MFFLCVLATFNINAQTTRHFNVCDSTEYTLNSDTVIIAGRYKLYSKTAGDNLSLIHDFSTADTSYFIRDFDIIRPNLWYALIGTHNLGGETTLYKSNDKGLTWLEDNSYFTAENAANVSSSGINATDPQYINSINQVQKIGTDTILLFLGYNTSGVVYSTDGGSSWKHWFGNITAHYFGLFECDSHYYLYEMPGFGTAARMFPFEKQYLFRQDSLVNFDHTTSGSGHHPPLHVTDDPNTLYYGEGLNSKCETYDFLKSHFDSLCHLASPTIQVLYDDSNLEVKPNPNKGLFTIELNNLTSPLVEIEIYNNLGQVVFRDSFQNLNHRLVYTLNTKLSQGLHYLVVTNKNRIFTKKLLID